MGLGDSFIHVQDHLTKPCFSSREAGRLFAEDAALGGRPGPVPQPVRLAAELRLHLLQQRQQPLPDIPGAGRRVHLERARR